MAKKSPSAPAVKDSPVEQVTFVAPRMRPPLGQLRRKHLLPTEAVVEVREDVMDNGVVRTNLVHRKQSLSDRFAGFQVRDFSLQSMILAGSLPQSPSFAGSPNLDAVSSSLDAAASALTPSEP